MNYSIRNLYKSYGEEQVLEAINLDINQRDFILIEGESGSGKTTLLNILSGLERPDEGSLLLNNKELKDLKEKDLTRIRKDNMGIIYQDTYIVEALTVEENFIFTQKFKKGNVNLRRVNEVIEDLGLEEKRKSFFKELSGGQRRRAMIGNLLVSDPKLIFADEPTNDLDIFWIEKVLYLLDKERKKGASIVLVSHLNKDIEYINKKYILKNKRLYLEDNHME